jgi:hypothetical protein
VRPAFSTLCSATWLRTLIVAAVVALTAEFAAAQPQEDPVRRPRMDTNPAPTQPAPGGIQQKTRPFYLEGAVVALLCGGAVFAVCRSSGRQ